MQSIIHPNERMQYTFQLQYVAHSHKYQDEVGNPIVSNQLQEISSPESMTNRRRDVIGSIQPKFVYQFAFLDYYEPMENWEVNENTNVDVFEELRKIIQNHLNMQKHK